MSRGDLILFFFCSGFLLGGIDDVETVASEGNARDSKRTRVGAEQIRSNDSTATKGRETTKNQSTGVRVKAGCSTRAERYKYNNHPRVASLEVEESSRW